MQKAFAVVLASWVYSISTEFFISLCFFLYCVASRCVCVREELGCRFTGFSLCYLQLSVFHWVFICFLFFSVLRLWYVAPSHLSWGFLRWAPSDYFLLQYFSPFFSLLLCTLWLNFVSLPGDQPIGRMAFTLLPVLFYFPCSLFYVIKLHSPRLPCIFLAPLSVQHTFQSFHKLFYPMLSVNWGLPLCLQAIIFCSNVSALLKRLLWPGWLLTGLAVLVTAQTSGTTDAHTLCLLSHLQRLSALVKGISYDHHEIPCLCRTSAEIWPM